MKNIFLCVITGIHLLIVSFSIAQPTLTANGINANVGESFTYNTCSYINPGGSGASQTWDFSSMNNNSSITVNMVTPSSTTYGSSFPLANVAWTTSSTANYFKISSTAFQNYGLYYSAYVIPYSNPEDMLRYPFSYNDTYNDTWATQFVSGGYIFYRTGTTTVTADGYGTLITPNGTYLDVLRVHLEQNYQDSAYISGYPNIITYNNNQYLWYKYGIHIQLASVYSLTSTIGSNSNGGSYTTGNVGINVSPESLISYDIYPNPASEKAFIDINLTKPQKIQIQLFNSLGQSACYDNCIDGIKGENIIQLDINQIPDGIYFAKVVCDNNIVTTKRFVISQN